MSLSNRVGANEVQRCGRIYLSTTPDRFTSIFDVGQPWDSSKAAQQKAAIQNYMRDEVLARCDDLITSGESAKEICVKMCDLQYGISMVSEMYTNCPIKLDDLVGEEAVWKFKERTGIWLYKLVTIYAAANAPKRRKGRGASHLDKAPMKDVVVDGVLWNPVYFRRFLPFQFINKITNSRIGDDMELLRLCNSTKSVIRTYDGQVTYKASKSYITPDDIRAKGYPEEADLHESFGRLQIVKSAILYYERTIILRNALSGISVDGSMQKLNEIVRDMSEADVINYLKFMQEYYCGTDAFWLTPGDYDILETGIQELSR